jgi:hypothetical protein
MSAQTLDAAENFPAAEAIRAEMPVPEKLDRTRYFGTWTGSIAGPSGRKIVGWNRDRQPVDADGKPIVDSMNVQMHFQNGRVYSDGGDLLPAEQVPPEVQAALDMRKRKTPVPGETHNTRILRCPVQGCNFSTGAAIFMERHKRVHPEVDENEWLRYQGKSGLPVTPFTSADFETVATSPTARTSEQGEG